MSALATIRDAVATAINAGTFSQAITATAAHVPANRLEALDALTVEVLGRAIERERAGRRVWTRKAVVVVGVQKRIAAATRDADADDLLELSDAIAAHLESFTFADGSLDKISEEPTIHAERLDQHSVFCRVLVLHFSLYEVNA
jgi:hypothetical protein